MKENTLKQLCLPQKKKIIDEHILSILFDLNGIIHDISEAYVRLLGIQKSNIIGQKHTLFKEDNPHNLFIQKLLSELKTPHSSWKGDFQDTISFNKPLWIHSYITPLYEKGKKIAYFALDKQSSAKKSTPVIDSITKLPTHDVLVHDISLLKTESMLLILHINQMDILKNLYGFDFTRTLLLRKAEQLKEITKLNSVSLYHLNLKEFAILIEDKKLFNKYLALLEHSIITEDEYYINTLNEPIGVDFSIGVAYGTKHLFNHADVVLQEAILSKRRYKIYEKTESCLHDEENKIKRLYTYKEALFNGNIIPYFQAIVDTQTKEIVKYEALARLQTKDGEIIAPESFLDSAKDDKSFEYFTRQVMQKIFHIYAKNPINISINLSYENIISKTMVHYIENRLKKFGGKGITFEVLESEDIEDYDKFNDFIQIVKEYGCKVAIDDFGSGYSNFSHILQLNIDYIKLDGSLIKQLNSNENIKNMIHGLVMYSKNANIKTIAEYVYNEELYNIVQELHVDYSQGYYFSEPQSPQELGFIT